MGADGLLLLRMPPATISGSASPTAAQELSPELVLSSYPGGVCKTGRSGCFVARRGGVPPDAIIHPKGHSWGLVPSQPHQSCHPVHRLRGLALHTSNEDEVPILLMLIWPARGSRRQAIPLHLSRLATIYMYISLSLSFSLCLSLSLSFSLLLCFALLCCFLLHGTAGRPTGH